MRLKPSQLPTLLLLTSSPVTRAFFEKAKKKLTETTLIYSDSLIDAFDYLSNTFVSSIVIDENIQNIDLAEICMKIRQLNGYQHTPILIITSHLKKSVTSRLLKSGATDFLIAPLKEESLFQSMKMAEEKQKTHKKLAKLSLPASSPLEASMHERVILDDRATRLISEVIGSDQTFVMLLLEIDQYSFIQSAYGKSVSEQLLLDFQAHLQKMVRKQDLLFPQAKGTFLILFPKTTSKAAMLMTEEIRESLKHKPFLKQEKHDLSVSVGLVTLDEKTSKTKSSIPSQFNYLMQTAKTYLKRAKEKRDSIVTHTPKW